MIDHASRRHCTSCADKLVVLRTIGATWLALVDRGHHVQNLLPGYLAAIDVEPIDDHTLAVLASGDGPRAVYTIDLAEPRPHHLIDADVLLSSSGGRVFVMTKDHTGVSVELATGKRETFELPADAKHPQGEDSWYVDDSRVRVRPMRLGKDHVVVRQPSEWMLINQNGSVLARSRPDKRQSTGFLLSSGVARPLATVHGGGAYAAITTLAGKLWAIIDHNTANFDGDLANTDAEGDVCMVPPAGDVTFPSRSVPLQFADKQKALFDAAEKASPGATVQILEMKGSQRMVYLELKETAGSDLELMRTRARALQHSVTSILGDREIKTVVMFADRRSAIMRWRRDRLGDHAVAGMGDVLLSDLADSDLEVNDLDNEHVGTQIKCSGTLTNARDRALRDIEIRCIGGDRKRVIAIPELGPHASQAFTQTFDVDEDDATFFEVVSGHRPLLVQDAQEEARLQKIFELATAVYRDTQLELVSRKVTEYAATLTLRAAKGFDKLPADERMRAVTTAYAEYKALRGLYDLGPLAPFKLHIDGGDRYYDFDGDKLTPAQ